MWCVSICNNNISFRILVTFSPFLLGWMDVPLVGCWKGSCGSRADALVGRAEYWGGEYGNILDSLLHDCLTCFFVRIQIFYVRKKYRRNICSLMNLNFVPQLAYCPSASIFIVRLSLILTVTGCLCFLADLNDCLLSYETDRRKTEFNSICISYSHIFKIYLLYYE